VIKGHFNQDLPGRKCVALIEKHIKINCFIEKYIQAHILNGK
jgi:hypothetical protein